MMKQTVLRGMREFQCRELPESGRVREREQVSGAALRRTLHTHIPCCRDRSPLDFSSAEMEEETAEHVRFPRSGLEQWRGGAGRCGLFRRLHAGRPRCGIAGSG